MVFLTHISLADFFFTLEFPRIYGNANELKLRTMLKTRDSCFTSYFVARTNYSDEFDLTRKLYVVLPIPYETVLMWIVLC